MYLFECSFPAYSKWKQMFVFYCLRAWFSTLNYSLFFCCIKAFVIWWDSWIHFHEQKQVKISVLGSKCCLIPKWFCYKITHVINKKMKRNKCYSRDKRISIFFYSLLQGNKASHKLHFGFFFFFVYRFEGIFLGFTLSLLQESELSQVQK